MAVLLTSNPAWFRKPACPGLPSLTLVIFVNCLPCIHVIIMNLYTVVGMIKTERASEPIGKSHSAADSAEVVTTSSSPIIFTSQPHQPKNRKRDFKEEERGPVPKIPRASIKEEQEIEAANENLISHPKQSLIDVGNRVPFILL